jgi:hypothetical protein
MQPEELGFRSIVDRLLRRATIAMLYGTIF